MESPQFSNQMDITCHTQCSHHPHPKASHGRPSCIAAGNWNFRYVGQLRVAFDMQPTGYVVPLGDQWGHPDSALQVQRLSQGSGSGLQPIVPLDFPQTDMHPSFGFCGFCCNYKHSFLIAFVHRHVPLNESFTC